MSRRMALITRLSSLIPQVHQTTLLDETCVMQLQKQNLTSLQAIMNYVHVMHSNAEQPTLSVLPAVTDEAEHYVSPLTRSNRAAAAISLTPLNDASQPAQCLQWVQDNSRLHGSYVVDAHTAEFLASSTTVSNDSVTSDCHLNMPMMVIAVVTGCIQSM